MIISAINVIITLFLRPNLSANMLVGISKINAEINVIEKYKAMIGYEKPLILKYKTLNTDTMEKPYLKIKLR